eukprot:Rmarinus@m.25622
MKRFFCPTWCPCSLWCSRTLLVCGMQPSFWMTSHSQQDRNVDAADSPDHASQAFSTVWRNTGGDSKADLPKSESSPYCSLSRNYDMSDASSSDMSREQSRDGSSFDQCYKLLCELLDHVDRANSRRLLAYNAGPLIRRLRAVCGTLESRMP